MSVTQGLSEQHCVWLEERGIACETAAECGLISQDTALGFPFRRNGELLFTKWRGPQKKFWIDPSGRRLVLWNLDSLRETSSDTLIITEGEIDALSWIMAGSPAVVSVPNGAPSKAGEGEIVPAADSNFSYLWTEDGKLIPELRKFKRILLSTDGDGPGRILAFELAVRLERTRCSLLHYPEGMKDANDVWKALRFDGMRALLDSATPIVPPRLVSYSRIPTDDRQAYTIGWAGLDQHIRLCVPELVIVSGSPGSGKSQWTLNVGANLARVHRLKGTILQFEDHPGRNKQDLLAYARSWSQEISDPEAWVDDMFRTVAPPEPEKEEDAFTLAWIIDTIKEAARVHDCKWIILDPWNEIEHLFGVGESETAYTNNALRKLKALCRALQIALFIVTHPTKSGGQNDDIDKVSLYDVSGSNAWNNKADHGVWLMRVENTDDSLVKITKAKDNLRMGRPGTVLMRFNRRNAQFEFIEKRSSL